MKLAGIGQMTNVDIRSLFFSLLSMFSKHLIDPLQYQDDMQIHYTL